VRAGEAGQARPAVDQRAVGRARWRGVLGVGAFAQAVALALERDHRAVVDEPVDQGRGDHRVAEDFAPGLEAAIAGEDDRAASVAARDEREQQVGGLAL
jgi:hypothetical protein